MSGKSENGFGKWKILGILTLLAVISVAPIVLAKAALASGPVDISAFKLKDGRVYKGGQTLEGEVNDIIGPQGPIHHWSVLGSDSNEALAEAETGVYFFASDGACLTFVPLDSEYEGQDVVFSPDGGMFVVVTGSGMRPDVFFNVYGELTEKIAEFSGLRGEIAWVDPVRVVMTRIDDTRETEGGVFSYYALRLSVVMFDTAAKETTVLKEATDRQNFQFHEVIENGGALTVTEQYVSSEKDWGDEEKIQNREIRVEIPATG